MPVSVLLPIPGEPPSSTSEPGTRPPPSTRSSSAIPASSRSTAGAWTSRSATGRGGAPARAGSRPPLRPLRDSRRIASTSVFHSPHPGQRPVQARAEWPHSWQTKWESRRAMGYPRVGTPPDATTTRRRGGRAEPAPTSEAVDVGRQLTELAQVRRRVDRPADDALDQLPRHELVAVPEQSLRKPIVKRRQLAATDPLVQIPQVLFHGVPDLSRDHVAQEISGEVAECPGATVDVLEEPAGVVRDIEPEILGGARVPGLGKVGELELAVEDRELELEAHRYVQVVGDLIGLDADQRRLDLVGRPMERLGVDGRKLIGKQLPQPRQLLPQVQTPPPHPVLPKATLGLVEAERRRARQRGPP